MKNIMNFRTYEQISIGTASIASMEDLTNYYKCNKCGKYFYLFNDITNTCKYCRSNDIVQSSVFNYFADLQKGDKDIYKKELNLQKKRSQDMIDLVGLGMEKEKRKIRSNYN